MKTINVTFEDSEMEQLENCKGDMTWRQFILQWIKQKKRSKMKQDTIPDNNSFLVAGKSLYQQGIISLEGYAGMQRRARLRQ